MDGTLHTDLWKSETNQDIKKTILISCEHLQKLYWFSKLWGRGSKIKPATPILVWIVPSISVAVLELIKHQSPKIPTVHINRGEFESSQNFFSNLAALTIQFELILRILDSKQELLEYLHTFATNNIFIISTLCTLCVGFWKWKMLYGDGKSGAVKSDLRPL